MKKVILSILTIILITNLVSAQTLDRSVRPKPGPAPEVKMGDAQSFVTSNGIQVFVVENHKLPRVSFSIDFNIKPELEKDKAGIASFVGDLMKAGTKTKSKDEFNKQLDLLGADLMVGDDGIYMQSLKKFSTPLLELASDMLLNPAFPEEELELLKEKAKNGLETEKDNPQTMSRNVSNVLNFGKNHYYGEIMTEQTIKNITLEDCKKYYETYFRPNVAYMAVVGDITMSEAKNLVEKYFGAWKQHDVPVARYETPDVNKGASVAVVNKSSAVQSVIKVTYPLDLKPGDKDVIPLKVATGILGGGMNGRLFKNLRETHGWTYGSYAGFNTSTWDHSGTFSATANSTAEATDSSITEILKEMNKMRTGKVSTEELEGFKTYMSGTFALGLEDPRTIARYAINIAKDDLPKDYYKNYLKNIEKVTKDDVLNVSKKYIRPDIAHITMAGDKASNLDKLKKFGPVTVYDMYGNEVKEMPSKPVAEGVTARSIVEKYVSAVGGGEKLKGVKDVMLKMEANMQGMPLTFKSAKKGNTKYLNEITAQGMTVQKSVFDGTKGYESQMGQQKEMEDDDLAEARENAIIFEELAYLSPAYSMELKGTENVDGTDCYIVNVKKPGGGSISEYYSMQSGLKKKSVTTMDAEQGKMIQSVYYDDYRDVDGIQFPHMIKQVVGPQKFELKVTEINVNSGIDDSLFQ